MKKYSATYAVALLTAMNLLNYADRYVPSAMKDLIKRDLRLSDVETGLPLTAFVIVYVVMSPLFGALADRFSRKNLIALAAALWAIATASAALAQGFTSFFLARAAVGIGEAAYATIAPSLISDLFPPERRNRALAVFYLAIPVGSALGFGAGGAVGTLLGWRAAFLVVGLPGLVTAALALRLEEPERGRFDEDKQHQVTWHETLRTLLRRPVFLVVVAGYAMVLFSAGAIADWFPTFLVRKREFDIAGAATVVSGVTVAGGICGTLAGSFIADRLFVGKTRHPYLAFGACAMVPATLCATACLIFRPHWLIIAFLLIGQMAAWSYNGPINALLVNSVPSGMRARAFSLTLLTTHLFGDALSPALVGFISDHMGGLTLAMTAVPISLTMGTIVWLCGWRFVPEGPK